MGRTILCACGQRNDLAVFGYGEAKLCLACGRSLTVTPVDLAIDPFIPEVPADAFSEDDPPPSTLATDFESPAPDAADGGAASGTPQPAPAIARERIWTGGVREAGAEGESECCTRCGRAFRGDWDRHESPTGPICHLCGVRADATYQPPSQGERRDLFRPVPPKPMATPEQDTARAEEWAQKKKGLTIIAVAGVVTVSLAMVMPVEVWLAAFFATDTERALELPTAWLWVTRVLNFATFAFAQGLALYLTLAMMDLLYDDRRDNLRAVAWLAIIFAMLHAAIDTLGSLFGAFGPAGTIFLALALLLSFIMKIMMIAGRFPLRAEGAVGFVFAWFIVSLLLGPGMQMVERLVVGMVAAIAL